MTIRNLPSPPWWTRWAPRFIGLGAIAMMVGGLVLALRRRGGNAADVDRSARRQALLDELVAIDADPARKAGKRRDAVLAELEKLW
jgi:hypothetical protein